MSTLVLSACGGAAGEIDSDPVEVVFNPVQDAVIDGTRLEPPEGQWDGYGEAVDVYG